MGWIHIKKESRSLMNGFKSKKMETLMVIWKTLVKILFTVFSRTTRNYPENQDKAISRSS